MTSKSTILVVEDDDDARDAMCIMLKSFGYTPLSFSRAKEALDGLQEQEVALALLDIMMPEMNGYELLQELKKIPRYAEIPIIMVTAKDQDSEILEGYQYGADYYITKPFTSKQLEYGIRIFLS